MGLVGLQNTDNFPGLNLRRHILMPAQTKSTRTGIHHFTTVLGVFVFFSRMTLLSRARSSLGSNGFVM